MCFISINGIVYKSTSTKLQKTAPNERNNKLSTENSNALQRTLVVRGEKFLISASGTKLIRAPDTQRTRTTSSSLPRIDIGGLTYVKDSNDTYKRTDFHRSRFHLSVAKQRSINVLSQHLVKTNVPCVIYRKLGKCAAYERSKCRKLHDPKLVDTCPKYDQFYCPFDGNQIVAE